MIALMMKILFVPSATISWESALCQSLHRHILLSISSAATALKKWKLRCDIVSLTVSHVAEVLLKLLFMWLQTHALILCYAFSSGTKHNFLYTLYSCKNILQLKFCHNKVFKTSRITCQLIIMSICLEMPFSVRTWTYGNRHWGLFGFSMC